MSALLSINSSLFDINVASAGSNLFKANPLITIATMSRVEIVVHTVEGREKYRMEERDGIFFIYKYQRHFLGFHRFKKLAQARNRENALKIIHILTAAEIVHLEVSPVDYFEGGAY